MTKLRRVTSFILVWNGILLHALAQGYAPVDAVTKMEVADGLNVRLVASEPMVRQPNFVKCDDRGRLWTIQYLQYPNPAGLKRVKVDRWSRTVYDRVPNPPPDGPRGADKITILDDIDGDAAADTAIDFVDGLNLVTGVAFGHGGVYVLNVPYLLFYPDRNRDDVPDSDPEVLLSGFGMEDAQSMSNHLTWGPDGWLYGVNGSTTTCRIRNIEFQQGLWRFHPRTHQFELFCEGGSNCYGVTFDANGEIYYSTNGGPFVHAVQGGYYFKSFGKHGPLHNPYAYHYFANLKCDQVPGGPPTGGTIYLGDSFPDSYRGRFIAGNFLGHTCSWWSIQPSGSTVTATFGGRLLDSNDTWFGPTDMCLGPDGSMFVCDFHDQRTAHPDPDASWDRSNGRIYKIESDSIQAIQPFDIRIKTSDELVDLLSHRNHWFRDRARCELAYRQDVAVVPRLRQMATQTEKASIALQGLWAYHVTAGMEDSLAITLLRHPAPYVRFWTVRLLADDHQVSSEIATRLAELAQSEAHPVVRSQLAASAKRLTGSAGRRMIQGLLEQNPNETDSRIPWLIWWAVESRAMTESDEWISMYGDQRWWRNHAAKANALRLIRRYAAEGTAPGYSACARLLTLVPPAEQSAAHQALGMGLSERGRGLSGIGQGSLFSDHAVTSAAQPEAPVASFEPLIGPLRHYIQQLWRTQPDDLFLLELALRADQKDAYQHLVGLATEVEPDQAAIFARVFKLLAQFAKPDAIAIALSRLQVVDHDKARLACLDVVAKFDSAKATQTLLLQLSHASEMLRNRIFDILLARPNSARELLQRVDAGEVTPQQIPLHQIRRIALHQDAGLNDLVRKYWGNVGPGSSEEKLATMRRYNNDLRVGQGDLNRGKLLFTKHCGTCHRLHGVGNNVGPDLTTANRSDRSALLANIVDPSGVVRSEYISYVAQTDSGQVLSGLLAEQDAASVTILDGQNRRTVLSRDEIEQLVPSKVSLMPEKILAQLSPQQLRDLFSYLEK